MASECDFDVFISYNWDHKVQVRKLYNMLTQTYGLKCWLDDVELKPNSLMDELAKGITNSKVFLCCITKQYCKSSNCIGEINHARNLDKPMVILMIERLGISALGGVGFIIGQLIRTNAYKFPELFDEPTGDLIKQVIKAVNDKLDEWNQKNKQSDAGAPAGGPSVTAGVTEFTVRSLNGHTGAVLCLQELSKNRLASGSSDFSVIIWTLNDFTVLKKLESHSDLVTCLKVLPEGRLASGSMDTTIVVWNLSSYEPLKVLRGHSEGITCLKVLPDGELCSGSNDYCLRVWSMKNYDCIKEIRGHITRSKKMILNIKKKTEKLIENTIFKSKPANAPSKQKTDSKEKPTEKSDETNNQDGKTENGEKNETKTEEKENVNPSDDTNKEPPISYDQAVQGMGASDQTNQTSESVTTISASEKPLDRKSSECSATKSSLNTRSSLDMSNGKKKPKILDKKKLLGIIKAKDRASMDTADSEFTNNDEMAEQEEVVENDDIPEMPEDEDGDEDEIIDPKLKKSKAASSNKMDGHTKAVYCLKNLKAVDGQKESRNRFLSGSGDKLIKVWSMTNYECQATLKGHTSQIICLKNLNKGRIASGSQDKTIRIWEMEKYTCIRMLNGHTSDVQCLQLLANNRLASGSCDTTIRIWNLGGKFECTKVIKEHTKYVNILKKLKTDRLISSSNDNFIKVWDVKTFECIETFKDHQRWISFILVLDSGKVSSCSWDGTIKVWKAANVTV